MIIHGVPTDIYKYIAVGLDLSHKLHQAGFPPMYQSGNLFYHKKSKEIEKYYNQLISKGGETDF